MSGFPRIKQAQLDWFQQLPAQIAFTGTAKQCRWHGPYREWLTVELLDANVRHVIKNVSRDILGRRRRLRYCGVIEGDQRGSVKRLHCHLAIGGIPAQWPLERVRDALEYYWSGSPWGDYEVNSVDLVTPDDNARWNTYMLKEFHPARAERWITNLQQE